jgi:hypothetical protein
LPLKVRIVMSAIMRRRRSLIGLSLIKGCAFFGQLPVEMWKFSWKTGEISWTVGHRFLCS